MTVQLATAATAVLAWIAVAGSAAAQDPGATAGATARITVPPDAEQLGAAIQAAPAERRDGVTVLGWNADGTVRLLREGSNDLVCLADDPRDDTFSVACYHVSLEPYMARGRALYAEGLRGMDRNQRRWEEAEAGTLAMPTEPATLYVLHGSGFDADADSVTDPYLRWSIYIPGATPESTGLDTRAGPGVPWLMFPGTPGAHIMIVPPQSDG